MLGRRATGLLATYEVNPGNPQTCLDLAALGQGCGPFGEDSPYSFDASAGADFPLPLHRWGAKRTEHSLLNPETCRLRVSSPVPQGALRLPSWEPAHTLLPSAIL